MPRAWGVRGVHGRLAGNDWPAVAPMTSRAAAPSFSTLFRLGRVALAGGGGQGLAAHRPGLGEIRLMGTSSGLVSAQRLGLGENRPLGRRRPLTFPQVNGPALLAGSPKPRSCALVFLPSRDVAPESPVSVARVRKTLPSRDLVQGEWRIVPPWERRSRWLVGRPPKPGRYAPFSAHRPCLGEMVLLFDEMFSQAGILRRMSGIPSLLGRGGLAGEVRADPCD